MFDSSVSVISEVRLSGEGNLLPRGIRWVFPLWYMVVISHFCISLLPYWRISKNVIWFHGYKYMSLYIVGYVKYCTWAFISVDKANDKREIIFNFSCYNGTLVHPVLSVISTTHIRTPLMNLSRTHMNFHPDATDPWKSRRKPYIQFLIRATAAEEFRPVLLLGLHQVL